jgi:hypothetical protein
VVVPVFRRHSSARLRASRSPATAQAQWRLLK